MIKAAENNIKFRENEIKERFKKSLGYELNLDNPKSFNEKIQWLKLYNHDPLITKCADKYLAREYIKEKIGEEYLIPLFGVWDNPDDIDFDALPNQFVLKVNWGWGQNIIVKDKSTLNIDETKEKLRNWLFPFSNNYYGSFEWGYKNINPKIICEKYIEQLNGQLYDYKVFCLSGNPKYIQLDMDRFIGHKRAIYDIQWNKMDFIYEYDSYDININKPKYLDDILNIAKKLSNMFAFIRIDFFILEENIFVGELTFTPESGNGKFIPEEWDYKLGELLQLPKEKKIEYDTLTREELISQACNLEYISRYYKNIQNKEYNKTTKRFILFGIENTKTLFILYFFGIKISIKK